MKTKQSKKGFTLVELVIVIAVIAILAAVLIPTFTTVIDNANKSAAEQEGSSLKTEILTLYQGEFDKYCEDYYNTLGSSATVSGSDNERKTSDSEAARIIPEETSNYYMTKYPAGTERPNTTLQEFLSVDETKTVVFTFKWDGTEKVGTISYQVGNYKVEITAKAVTATKA